MPSLAGTPGDVLCSSAPNPNDASPLTIINDDSCHVEPSEARRVNLDLRSRTCCGWHFWPTRAAGRGKDVGASLRGRPPLLDLWHAPCGVPGEVTVDVDSGCDCLCIVGRRTDFRNIRQADSLVISRRPDCLGRSLRLRRLTANWRCESSATWLAGPMVALTVCWW